MCSHDTVNGIAVKQKQMYQKKTKHPVMYDRKINVTVYVKNVALFIKVEHTLHHVPLFVRCGSFFAYLKHGHVVFPLGLSG